MSKTEALPEVRILKCPSCGGPIEVPNLCIYCGHKLVIEGLKKDEELRDLELETEVFLYLQRLAELLDIEVKFASKPTEEMAFSYLAKRRGSGKRDWREVGGMQHSCSAEGAEYMLAYATPPQAIKTVTFLRIKSLGLPDNSRIYLSHNEHVNFMEASFTLEDFESGERNPVWLMLVQMLANVDPEAVKKLKTIAVRYERGEEVDDLGVDMKAIASDFSARTHARIMELHLKGCGFEFGDDPYFIMEIIEFTKDLNARLKTLMNSLKSLDGDSVAIAGYCSELQKELDRLEKWLVKVEKGNWGCKENTRELQQKLEDIWDITIKIWDVLKMKPAGEVISNLEI